LKKNSVDSKQYTDEWNGVTRRKNSSNSNL